MNINSFDTKLLFLSFLDSYQNKYIYGDSLSPEFKFLASKGAFMLAAERLTPELKKDFLKNLGY